MGLPFSISARLPGASEGKPMVKIMPFAVGCNFLLTTDLWTGI